MFILIMIQVILLDKWKRQIYKTIRFLPIDYLLNKICTVFIFILHFAFIQLVCL